MAENANIEYPYDEFLEPILEAQKKRLAEADIEDEEELNLEQPYWVMVARLKRREALTTKQASDYVYEFCIRKALDIERPMSPMFEITAPSEGAKRKPWWRF